MFVYHCVIKGCNNVCSNRWANGRMRLMSWVYSSELTSSRKRPGITSTLLFFILSFLPLVCLSILS